MQLGCAPSGHRHQSNLNRAVTDATYIISSQARTIYNSKKKIEKKRRTSSSKCVSRNPQGSVGNCKGSEE